MGNLKVEKYCVHCGHKFSGNYCPICGTKAFNKKEHLKNKKDINFKDRHKLCVIIGIIFIIFISFMAFKTYLFTNHKNNINAKAESSNKANVAEITKAEVPNICGYTIDQAKQILKNAGLKLGNIKQHLSNNDNDKNNDGKIILQSKPHGLAVAKGAKIDVEYIKFSNSNDLVNNSNTNAIYSANTEIKLDNNLKEDLMYTINEYNSSWFSAMINKNANLIVNATQNEKDRTNSLIKSMNNNGKSYTGYMIKTIYDLDSVKLEQQNGEYIAYISDSEYFNDVYYTGDNPKPLSNHTLWKYKLIYNSTSKMWLVDSHTALNNFNPTNKREF